MGIPIELQIGGKKGTIGHKMANKEFFQRQTLIIGPEAASGLEKSRVIVFGLGGVGSWCAEALVRSGIGKIDLVDFDLICASNINRQVEAVSSTLGRLKTEALEERLKEINPSCGIRTFPVVFSKETSGMFDISGADYVIDAIDSLSSKLDLIEISLAAGTRFFSSMGMARKLDPTLIRTADIWETRGCPLAALVRQGLRKRGFSGHFTAVYSPERLPSVPGPQTFNQTVFSPLQVETTHTETGSSPDSGKKTGNSPKTIGSSVTVTAAAGMVLASLVIRNMYARCGGDE